MVDIDAIGGAATGGLIASQFEKPAGQAGEHASLCADCGTETIGRFCHACGNPSHTHRTLLHLGEELLHGVMHFDSRTWRTLPLLAFRPGKLTRDWVTGKRTRYVSPLAIFLFTIFVLFMAISYFPGPKQTLAQARAEATVELNQELADVAKLRARLATAAPEDRADVLGDLRGEEKEVAVARQEIAKLAKIRGEDGWAEQIKANNGGVINFKTGDPKVDAKLKKKLENPELALYKLQQSFYKFSFLLIPISIPFVALLFVWKRGFTLYDHGVFVLYSMTFMSMLIMLVAASGRIGGPLAGTLAGLLPFAVPAHMFFQLKGAYGLSAFSALWRTFFLLIFSFLALLLFAAAIVLMDVI